MLVQRECSMVGSSKKSCTCKTELNKLWYIPIMDDYVSIKMKETELHTSTWINLEAVMLSMKSKSQYVMCIKSKNVKTILYGLWTYMDIYTYIYVNIKDMQIK